MTLGERRIRKGDRGADVEELQIRLAGFRGTIPDGGFGPGTELQVATFQRDFMRLAQPTGEVDTATIEAFDRLAEQQPLDFGAMRCPCGVCTGFGRGQFRGAFHVGKPSEEGFHRFEYPGIHRMLLWAVRALCFYMPQHRFVITSGYRCEVQNEKTGRTSTNHHGKAIDLDVIGAPGEDKRDDMRRCDAIRGVVVETANAQIGWHAANRKALEPSDIAPTWIHYDVRRYDAKYLVDRFFCTSVAMLDSPAIPES